LHNPGAILLYTYGEEGGSDLGMTRSSQTVEEARADGIASDNPKEFEDPNTGKETAPDDVAAVMPDSEVMEVVARGGPQFAQTCSTCHGPAGRSDAAAVLAENEKLTDAGYVASTVVHGFGYMPAFGSQLSDTEIAEIGTYIRNSWGNDYGVLTTDDVAQAR
jgi:mono/diheme cytochrome c family protein